MVSKTVSPKDVPPYLSDTEDSVEADSVLDTRVETESY